MTIDTVHLSLQSAETMAYSAFEALGVPEKAARSVANALVAAEAEGQSGHGFSRLSEYASQVRSGKINAIADPIVSQPAPAVIHVDAQEGFAFPAIDAALTKGIPLAKEQGIALMCIGNSHHCGALSLHVEKIAQSGLIGLMVSNTPKAIAPWGAKAPVFGTNPIAFSAPRASNSPLVIDLSLSQVARGKIMAAKKKGEKIPLGWALNAAGNPTDNPEAALGGTMVPIGGAKGTALALMVEILAAALTESAFSFEASSFFEATGPAPRVGQTIVAINPGTTHHFAHRLEQLISEICRHEGARLPGQRRSLSLSRAKTYGLDIPIRYVDDANKIATTNAILR